MKFKFQSFFPFFGCRYIQNNILELTVSIKLPNVTIKQHGLMLTWIQFFNFVKTEHWCWNCHFCQQKKLSELWMSSIDLNFFYSYNVFVYKSLDFSLYLHIKKMTWIWTISCQRWVKDFLVLVIKVYKVFSL